MYFLYSIILTIGFLLMLPLFLLRREKYASGFSQRLGNYAEFKHADRDVIWIHCVSVGETNAARPLVAALKKEFPEHRLVISTTTRTGQELARKIFAGKGDAIVYFPFDFKFSVRRALNHFKPSLVLLMETEIWPRFIHDAKRSGAKIAIINGRVSHKSFARYSRFRAFMRRVLADVDVALMQYEADAKRIIDLGMDTEKVAVTGNLKFEQTAGETDYQLTEEFRERFKISPDKPLIIAASTHEPEERYVLESLDGELGHSCRLMIVPRHPERFNAVEKLLRESPYRNTYVLRSSPATNADKDVEIILLDTIGELRSAYPLAEIVFVGGSLVPHGGQSILEPASEGRAIVTGPYTANFDAVVREFLDNDALLQTSEAPDEFQISERLSEQFIDLLGNQDKRIELGQNALALMTGADRNATSTTVELLTGLVRR
jgi:3-deoxy-D-manno-octulosonic-acid transferase